MLIFLSMTLTVLTIAILVWWAFRDPGARILAALLMTLMVMPLPASAAQFDIIIDAVVPQLLEIVALILAAMLAWASAKAKAKWGIDIEARHRDALHSAIMTGVRLALAKGMDGPSVVTAALDHARLSVPDAINALGAGKTVLVNLAEAKMQEAVSDVTRKLGAS
ncbi:hypothetical protein E2976_17745 [Paracoccus yeei]|uniref:hypothetical protein n=1 Tax=Paracoccus yeei TaxID=147645 RepID=UPI003BF8B614